MTFDLKPRVTNFDDRSVTLFHSHAPTPEAEFAMKLIERWGLVAAVDDGEDSQGRAKAKLVPPVEVVSRAFEIASLMFGHIEGSGMFIAIPDAGEINADKDRRRAEEEAEADARRAAKKTRETAPA